MIISLAMQKGGSGKTTTAVNLAAMLRDKGNKMLLVDMDPQANLSQSMGLLEDREPNVYHLLKKLAQAEDASIRKAICHANGMDLIPSSLELAGAELELVSIWGRERLLSQLLKQVSSDYDFIIIDCPPSIGLLTINALTASDYIIMPLQAEFLPFKGLQSFMLSFKIVKKQLNTSIKVLGYVLTKYDRRKNMNKQVWEQLSNEYGELVFQTRIRSNIALAQSQEKGMDIFTYNKRCNGAIDYEQFAEEVIKRINYL